VLSATLVGTNTRANFWALAKLRVSTTMPSHPPISLSYVSMIHVRIRREHAEPNVTRATSTHPTTSDLDPTFSPSLLVSVSFSPHSHDPPLRLHTSIHFL